MVPSEEPKPTTGEQNLELAEQAEVAAMEREPYRTMEPWSPAVERDQYQGDTPVRVPVPSDASDYMHAKTSQLRTALRVCSSCSELTFVRLLHIFSEATAVRRQLLQQQGKPASTIWLVTSGEVRIVLRDRTGRVRHPAAEVGIAVSGSLLGELHPDSQECSTSLQVSSKECRLLQAGHSEFFAELGEQAATEVGDAFAAQLSAWREGAASREPTQLRPGGAGCPKAYWQKEVHYSNAHGARHLPVRQPGAALASAGLPGMLKGAAIGGVTVAVTDGAAENKLVSARRQVELEEHKRIFVQRKLIAASAYTGGASHNGGTRANGTGGFALGGQPAASRSRERLAEAVSNTAPVAGRSENGRSVRVRDLLGPGPKPAGLHLLQSPLRAARANPLSASGARQQYGVGVRSTRGQVPLSGHWISPFN